jgi:DNA-binding NarL/FixJ family response regulator
MSSLIRRKDTVRPGLPGKPWRVLIVEDHPLYRDALRELFKNQLGLIIAGEAETENDAFEQVLAGEPDLLTVDVTLASGNGLNLISRVKQHTSTPHVLVVSMYEDRAYADLAIAAGASGYISKHTDRGELTVALDTIGRGEIYVSPCILNSALRTHTAPGASGLTPKERRLSGRELQIFSLIGRGRNTHEIAAELAIAVSTVETYRERLKTKLNLASGSELARHAYFWAMYNPNGRSDEAAERNRSGIRHRST